ncbi:MAG: Omp28-related outer membrane protein [Bacteroidia bacterium]
MKKFTLALLLALPFFSQAQLNEHFSGLSGFGTTGWGTALPTGWMQYNQDGLTPASQVAANFPGGAAWVSRYVASITDTFVVSTSWYTPAGISNDWLVTPGFTVPTASAGSATYLTWEVYSPDANYPDGYIVKISTTGNAVANFTAPAVYTEVAGPSAGFESRGIDISAYAGQTINVAFINNSNDMYYLFLDDVQTKVLSSVPDVKVNSAAMAERFYQTGGSGTINANITNKSGGVVNTASVVLTPTGGTPVTVNLTNLNLGPLASKDVTINFTAPATVNEYDYSINFTTLNGNADPVPADNSATGLKASTVLASNLPPKAVLIEEGTGTWCGWCPRGAVAMEYMYDTYGALGNFVGIAVHNGDPMTVTEYDDGAALSGFPGCNVDRVMKDASVSQALFEQYYNTRKALVAPASIGVTPTLTGTALSVTLKVDFRTKVSTGLRLGVIVSEDSVHGTASGYAQTNYYSSQSQNIALTGAGHNWQTATNPVAAALMWYDHVGRALLGGYAGQTGSVPAIVNDGQSVSYTFNYTVPATMDPTELSVAAVLVDETTGAVYNTKMEKVGSTIAINPKDVVTLDFEVFPNPANEQVNVAFKLDNAKDVQVEVFTLTGQRVLNQAHNNLVGEQTISLDTRELAAGSYLVSVSFEGNSFIKRVVINK